MVRILLRDGDRGSRLDVGDGFGPGLVEVRLLFSKLQELLIVVPGFVVSSLECGVGE